ncbi:MAG: O-antigen ligase family protein, partial [Planctomycetia bacterium]
SSGSGLCVVLLELCLVGLVLLDALFSLRRIDGKSTAVTLGPWAWLTAGVVWASAAGADYFFAAQVAAWEWTGLAAVWTAAAWFSRGVGPRPLLAVLTALCLAEAGCAFWQVGVEYPDLRRRYEARDPIVMDEVRRTIGVEPGSPEAEPFRDRLFSKEPLGTFAHPNSLAGLFVLGLPAVAAVASTANGRGVAFRLWLFLPAGLTAFALLLTKARSAWVGALVAVGLFWLLGDRPLTWLRRRWPGIVAGAALLAAAAFVLVQLRLLDLLVLTESVKSLRYRLEWWQASLPILAERPWLGIGFGNFRSWYLGYKLPFSSEEVADPHNWLLELACCGGLPLLFAYSTLRFGSLLGIGRTIGGTPIDTDGIAQPGG